MLGLSKGIRSPKLYFGAASSFTFSGEYAPGAGNLVVILLCLNKNSCILHAALHTRCIDRFLVRSFTSQTVLRSFIQIHFLRTVSVWRCEVKVDAIYNNRVFNENYILTTTWRVTGFTWSVFNTKTVLRRIIQSHFLGRIRSRC